MTLALLVTLLIVPTLPQPPLAELFSSVWWSTLLREIAIGVLMGFTLQLVFEAVILGGELISASSSLSFATRADPLRGTRSEERRVGQECVSTCRSRWSP